MTKNESEERERERGRQSREGKVDYKKEKNSYICPGPPQ